METADINRQRENLINLIKTNNYIFNYHNNYESSNSYNLILCIYLEVDSNSRNKTEWKSLKDLLSASLELDKYAFLDDKQNMLPQKINSIINKQKNKNEISDEALGSLHIQIINSDANSVAETQYLIIIYIYNIVYINTDKKHYIINNSITSKLKNQLILYIVKLLKHDIKNILDNNSGDISYAKSSNDVVPQQTSSLVPVQSAKSFNGVVPPQTSSLVPVQYAKSSAKSSNDVVPPQTSSLVPVQSAKSFNGVVPPQTYSLVPVHSAKSSAKPSNGAVHRSIPVPVREFADPSVKEEITTGVKFVSQITLEIICEGVLLKRVDKAFNANYVICDPAGSQYINQTFQLSGCSGLSQQIYIFLGYLVNDKGVIKEVNRYNKGYKLFCNNNNIRDTEAFLCEYKTDERGDAICQCIHVASPNLNSLTLQNNSVEIKQKLTQSYINVFKKFVESQEKRPKDVKKQSDKKILRIPPISSGNFAPSDIKQSGKNLLQFHMIIYVSIIDAIKAIEKDPSGAPSSPLEIRLCYYEHPYVCNNLIDHHKKYSGEQKKVTEIIIDRPPNMGGKQNSCKKENMPYQQYFLQVKYIEFKKDKKINIKNTSLTNITKKRKGKTIQKVKKETDINGMTHIGASLYKESNPPKIGTIIAGNSGRPGGACGNFDGTLVNIKPTHRTQEEDIISNWIMTYMYNNSSIPEEKKKDCVDNLFKNTIYKKWGLEFPYEKRTDNKDYYKTIQNIDYRNAEAHDYATAWTIDNVYLSDKFNNQDGSSQYIYENQYKTTLVFVAGPNNYNPGTNREFNSIFRTYNEETYKHFHLFMNGVEAALFAGLIAMVYSECNVALLVNVSGGLYRGKHNKEDYKHAYLNSLNNLLMNVQINGVELGRYFDKVILVEIE